MAQCTTGCCVGVHGAADASRAGTTYRLDDHDILAAVLRHAARRRIWIRDALTSRANLALRTHRVSAIVAARPERTVSSGRASLGLAGGIHALTVVTDQTSAARRAFAAGANTERARKTLVALDTDARIHTATVATHTTMRTRDTGAAVDAVARVANLPGRAFDARARRIDAQAARGADTVGRATELARAALGYAATAATHVVCLAQVAVVDLTIAVIVERVALLGARLNALHAGQRALLALQDARRAHA